MTGMGSKINLTMIVIDYGFGQIETQTAPGLVGVNVTRSEKLSKYLVML